MKMKVEFLVFSAELHFRIFGRIATFSILSCKKMLFIGDQTFPDIQKQQFTVKKCNRMYSEPRIEAYPLILTNLPCAADGISVLLPNDKYSHIVWLYITFSKFEPHTVYPVTPNAGMFYQRGYKQ